MNKAESLVIHGQVEYVEGADGFNNSSSADAWRIKVRLDSDGPNKSTMELPYAFPLLPKTIQAIPKVGEGVLVLTARIGEYDSQRYYIGPIISQPQFQEYCSYLGGRGDAMSQLSGAKNGVNDALTGISRAKGETRGAFPSLQDVALLGRGQEDIVLKYRGARDGYQSSISEADIRAGIRLEPANTSVKYMQGNIVFNAVNPGYIQVKHSTSGLSGLKEGSGDGDSNKYEGSDKRQANSIINVVADKINLISHKDSNQFGEKITDRDELVKESELDDLMSQLHRSVYGDELITLLKTMIKAIKEHTHPQHGMVPIYLGTSVEECDTYNFEKIISPNVRIS